MVLATAVPRWKLSPVSTSSRMLSFGGDNSSSRSNSPRQLADEAIEWFAGHSPRNKTSAFNKQGLSLQIIFLAILVVATSWAACAHTSHRTSLLLRQLQDKQARYRLHLDHTYESLDQSRHAYKQETALLKKWRKTEKALEHELRVMQELANANVKMYPMSNRAPTEIVTEWLEHRQVGLERQVDTMSKYLQNYSKDRVLERYGAGPHRIRITAELQNKLKSSFVIELFPLDAMPHSIHFFLDLVTAHVWDDTVFLHHEAVEHVLATAPMDYYTQKIKHAHLHTLGWANLGFPEYQDAFPHEKYTLGFAGRGPTFYINTVDNSHIHGPGGQGHHLLPRDGDPCFGKVVEGHDVVDALVAFGLQEAKSTTSDGDNEHAWTHIVSVELLPSRDGRY